MRRRDQTHIEQPTLWDTVVAPAIDRSDKNADDDWKAAADECLMIVAGRLAEFTADDVCELLEQRDVTTHNLSALGPVFLRASRRGVISNADRMQQSRIPRRHRKLTVWNSLVYEGAKSNG